MKVALALLQFGSVNRIKDLLQDEDRPQREVNAIIKPFKCNQHGSPLFECFEKQASLGGTGRWGENLTRETRPAAGVRGRLQRPLATAQSRCCRVPCCRRASG